MRTEYLLLTQYDGMTAIPAEVVCRDFFSHLTPAKFIRNVNEGKIRLPMMRMDGSAKTARAVHVSDLAAYLDERRISAIKEAGQLSRAG